MYQEYDPETLEPTTAATSARMQDLAPLQDVVRGRSVLDMGCNAGLVSIHALKWGADKVTAVDVTRDGVEFLAGVAARHHLPITTRIASFNALDPDADGADVVLMLEVIHWLVAQGQSLEAVVERLGRLTRQVLVIETPWSVDEPSIRRQTTLTPSDYGMDLVLEALLGHFRSVEFVKFCRYFSADGASKRALLFARDPIHADVTATT
jgi:SAM-dependent methyltransferase